MTSTIAEMSAAIRQRTRTMDLISLTAIGLVVVAVTASIAHTVVTSPTIQPSVGDRVAGAAGGLAVTDRLSGFGVAEPSGVAVDQTTGNLFVVGDEGTIAELGSDGAAIRAAPAPRGVEDIALHAPTGLLVAVVEETSELVVLAPDTLAEMRRFPLDRGAILGADPGEVNHGFEGLAFRPDASQPGGGTFYLSHQRNPAMIIGFSLDPTAEPHPIGAGSVAARWTLAGTEELNAITYSAPLGQLLAVDDKRATLIVVDLQGHVVGELALPGDQQEGAAIDANGTLWISDDAAGELLAIERAHSAIAELNPVHS